MEMDIQRNHLHPSWTRLKPVAKLARLVVSQTLLHGTVRNQAKSQQMFRVQN